MKSFSDDLPNTDKKMHHMVLIGLILNFASFALLGFVVGYTLLT